MKPSSHPCKRLWLATTCTRTMAEREATASLHSPLSRVHPLWQWILLVPPPTTGRIPPPEFPTATATTLVQAPPILSWSAAMAWALARLHKHSCTYSEMSDVPHSSSCKAAGVDKQALGCLQFFYNRKSEPSEKSVQLGLSGELVWPAG